MEVEESFERAVADLEMLSAMYPDETSVSEAVSASTSTFPLQISFRFSETAHIQLELVVGYPIDTGIQVVKYRSSPDEKARMEEAVTAFRSTAKECLDDGIEGCFACCAAALETWNDFDDGGDELGNNHAEIDPSAEGTEAALQEPVPQPPEKVFHWISGEPLVDRKSTFIAHACRISSDKDVREALHQLLDGNAKLKRTTHNMVSAVECGSEKVYRFGPSLSSCVCLDSVAESLILFLSCVVFSSLLLSCCINQVRISLYRTTTRFGRPSAYSQTRQRRRR
jgi:hypothetical protein